MHDYLIILYYSCMICRQSVFGLSETRTLDTVLVLISETSPFGAEKRVYFPAKSSLNMLANGADDNRDSGLACEDNGQEADDSSQQTTLQPFVHQVGGHSNMFTYEGNTICKPLFEKEYEFYRTMPEGMRPFAPICKGNFDVLFHKDADSQVHISIMSPVRPLRRQNEIRSTTNQSTPNPDEYRKSERSSAVVSRSNFEKNPWSERCHQRMLDQMKSESESPKKYIILENAVIGFKTPSILDLKMGTRQHGLDDNEFKTDLKIGRCLSSTSCTLGFRVGGMQVYQKDTDDFFRQNKYSVEAVNKNTIHETFYKYLFNGVRLRLELIDPIVEKLGVLLLTMAKRNDVRLFSSSLMVMYESIEEADAEKQTDEDHHVQCPGCDKSDDQSDPSPTSSTVEQTEANSGLKVDIKMIDFAHSFHTASRNDVEYVGPDVGYIFGLENIIKIFLKVKERYSESRS